MSDENIEQTEEKTKRTRTSPRTKFSDEILSMVDACLSDLAKQDQDDITVQSKIEIVNDIRGRVVELASDGPKNEYSGKHYIGRRADGTLVAFDSNIPPTKRAFGPETTHGFSAVWGPQRTKEGRVYRMENPAALDATTPVFA